MINPEIVMIFELLAVLIIGLIVGSFLCVCVYRIPASREEFFSETPYASAEHQTPIEFNKPERSICPKCKNQLNWYHNIPVLSWLLLRGRCAFCKSSIPLRYPSVELLSALAALLSYHNYGFSLSALLIYIFVCALIVISYIDYDFMIIPNVISIPGTIIGVAIAFINQLFSILEPPFVAGIEDCFWGLLAGGGFLWLVAEFYIRIRKMEGLGFGDVKLLAMVGATFGWPAAIYTIFIGSMVGSLGGLLLIIVKGRKFSQHIPFGPYLAIGTVLYLFSGNAIIDWWFRLIGGGLN